MGRRTLSNSTLVVAVAFVDPADTGSSRSLFDLSTPAETTHEYDAILGCNRIPGSVATRPEQ